MKKLFSLAVLLPVLAFGQGLSPSPPWSPGGGKVLASYPLSTTGALIDEDANTVAHVYWNGSALVDTKGNSWTQNGTVPQVTANPFTTTRYGAGPFSTSNYYSLASPNPLQFASDFTVCAVVSCPATPAAENLILAIGATSSKGYDLGICRAAGAVGAGGVVGSFRSGATVALQSASAGQGLGVGPHVVCFGKSGATGYLKVDLATTVTGVASGYVQPTTAALIGVYTDLTSGPAVSPIYEVYATSSPWSEANVTAIQQKVLGHFDGSSALAVTRTTNATYENPAGTVWTAPAGVARITTDGLLVEPARTNYALQSNTLTTTWIGDLATSIASSGVASPAGGFWYDVTTTNIAGSAYQTTTLAATTLVGSVWAVKASGSSITSISGLCNGINVGTCACSRSDGGSCTATVELLTKCVVRATIGTTPVRLASIYTCVTPTVTPIFALAGGDINNATGTTRFSGAQLEVGTYPTSLIVTGGGTSVLRAADAISATVPAVPSKFCMAGSYKPPETMKWNANAGQPVLSFGASGAANSASLTSAYTQMWGPASATTYGRYSTGIDTTTGSHRLVSCWVDSTPGFAIDGATASLTDYNVAANSKWTTVPTTLNLSLGNSAMLLKNLKICAAKSAKECR
jgi:hypothetical protein